MHTACMKYPTYDSLFNTKSGYWQMPVVENRKYRWFSAFVANDMVQISISFQRKLCVNLAL